MHWIIQSNLVGAEDALRLREALTRLGTAWTDVKLIPIVQKLETVPQVEGNAFVYGSTYAHRAAFDQGWWPGYIGGVCPFEAIVQGYGEELLNFDVTYSTLRALTLHEPTFVRPDNDGKLFTGKVFWPGEEEAMRELLLAQNTKPDILDEVVVLSRPKRIFAEHRFLEVDGEVVTGSTCRRGNRVLYDNRIDAQITRYAQNMADRFQPDIGFALDVAETADGLRVIEANALSSAGLYACDLLAFAHAINQLDLCSRDRRFRGPRKPTLQIPTWRPYA